MRLRRLLFGGKRTPEEEAENEAERKRKEEEERKRKAEEAAKVKKRGYQGYFGEGKKRGKMLDEADDY